MGIYIGRCRDSIRRITEETGASEDIAYRMLLMTATMMDLRPEDEETVEIILKDCGVTV